MEDDNNRRGHEIVLISSTYLVLMTKVRLTSTRKTNEPFRWFANTHKLSERESVCKCVRVWGVGIDRFAADGVSWLVKRERDGEKTVGRNISSTLPTPDWLITHWWRMSKLFSLFPSNRIPTWGIWNERESSFRRLLFILADFQKFNPY